MSSLQPATVGPAPRLPRIVGDPAPEFCTEELSAETVEGALATARSR